jgi:hypothetical protein
VGGSGTPLTVGALVAVAALVLVGFGVLRRRRG